MLEVGRKSWSEVGPSEAEKQRGRETERQRPGRPAKPFRVARVGGAADGFFLDPLWLERHQPS